MELLSSPTTSMWTALCFKGPVSRLSFVSTSNPFKPKKHFINFPKLTSTSSSRQFITQHAVSASSSIVSVNDAERKKDNLPADLEVIEIKEPNSRVRLKVGVPPVVCKDCYQRVLAEFTKQAKVPGFRPGKKVPQNILINFVGKENVWRATIESILKRTLPHALSSVEGKALKDSVHITTNFTDLAESFSSPEDFLRANSVEFQFNTKHYMK
ncbi:Trigger factor-like protein tig protein [Thalictrum thalictroides]|uniref:peptidylprolyl isomerase n=1 Tax=Thalictrum thalictroides TaxID=46969 RepID=A0A7J6W4Y5_THATH|nr:Trigger factor-like protein tig protein [Thalictrum thalictroides]